MEGGFRKAGGSGVVAPLTRHRRLAADADEKTTVTPPHRGVHAWDEGDKVDFGGFLLSVAETADKVPVIVARRQRSASLVRDVFAHRVFARVQPAR